MDALVRSEPKTIYLRCSLPEDHLESHAIMHDNVVLLAFGLDDHGGGVINGGIMRIHKEVY